MRKDLTMRNSCPVRVDDQPRQGGTTMQLTHAHAEPFKDAHCWINRAMQQSAQTWRACPTNMEGGEVCMKELFSSAGRVRGSRNRMVTRNQSTIHSLPSNADR